jgi:hypothetical protein
MKLLPDESGIASAPKKIFNLKEEYNWRGDVAELLAKHHYGARRTKGYDFRREPGLSAKENTFLKTFWKRIDLLWVR